MSVPKIYRAMKASTDTLPEAGSSARTLGARPNDLPVVDGMVAPRTGGMSVSPALADLPPQWVPKRLAHLREGAEGPNTNHVFRHGTGSFASAAVAPHLVLRPDAQDHGLVEPDQPMPWADYQAALHATRADWVVDEK